LANRTEKNTNVASTIYRKRLADMRALMKKKRIDALVIPSSDPHLGEYVPDHWRIIRWLTGFTGSAGNVVITRGFAGLWTDSRYFIQAEQQLAGTGFNLVRLRIAHNPEYIDWLKEKIRKNGTVAVDGRLISAGQMRLLESMLFPRGVKINIRTDLVTPLWHDRPALPPDSAFILPLKYAGEKRSDKIARVRARMDEMHADYHLLTAADDVMWLLNIRGRDLKYSPLLLSFAILSHDQVLFFADEEKIPRELKAEFDNEGIVLLPYDTVADVLNSLPDGSSLLFSPATVSATLRYAVPVKVKIIEEVSIPTRLKAIRNRTEIKNLREVMVRDGVALTRFFHWLEKNIGRERITELSASAILESFRAEGKGYAGPSFATIAAYNEHAALPHYTPDSSTDVTLERHGIFLLDSGGQYYGGTTDITRTVVLGKPSPAMKKDFTLALKGTISLAMARFPYGTKGYQIEVLARKALWDNGLNYGHGTGHGVGSFLNVHEGPQTIGSAASGDMKTFLEPGMLISDEPAMYRPGQYGFRTENLLLCADDHETGYGRFLRFETVSLCYIDQQLIDKKLLDDNELKWLNDYHETVFRSLGGLLESGLRKWLRDKTLPLRRK
jgi:Xaa-Pro aminopeptidase